MQCLFELPSENDKVSRQKQPARVNFAHEPASWVELQKTK
jgi:hypothetical protein